MLSLPPGCKTHVNMSEVSDSILLCEVQCQLHLLPVPRSACVGSHLQETRHHLTHVASWTRNVRSACRDGLWN